MSTANTTRIRSGKEQNRLTALHLMDENQAFAGTGGVSSGNQHRGFRPAFLETGSGEIYLSRFADGRLAPIHVLDGLPKALTTKNTPAGRASATRGSVISGFVSGFVRGDRFYTREQTANLVSVSA